MQCQHRVLHVVFYQMNKMISGHPLPQKRIAKIKSDKDNAVRLQLSA
jgi:hypothetical protein